MRSMASGAAFHRAYLHATQQAFLEAHEHAFAYFGGVFRLLRYDNLASAVRKILRGYRREETVRFMAFRSHWRFAAEFCTPGEGHEKGGIEGEGGYFRRNHLVPVPCVADLDALNALLLTAAVRTRRGCWMAAPTRSARRWRGARPSAVVRDGRLRPGRGHVPAGGQARLRHGEDQLLLGASPRGHPGGSAHPSAACRDLACRSPDCPPRTLPQPPPACARSRALPRCAEPQAGRVRRIEAAGAMA